VRENGNDADSPGNGNAPEHDSYWEYGIGIAAILFIAAIVDRIIDRELDRVAEFRCKKCGAIFPTARGRIHHTHGRRVETGENPSLPIPPSDVV
jgi:hypothetical protein